MGKFFTNDTVVGDLLSVTIQVEALAKMGLPSSIRVIVYNIDDLIIIFQPVLEVPYKACCIRTAASIRKVVVNPHAVFFKINQSGILKYF